MSKTKKCKKCNNKKPLEEFYFRKDTKSYKNICKLCHIIAVKEYANNNKDVISSNKKRLREKYKNDNKNIDVDTKLKYKCCSCGTSKSLGEFPKDSGKKLGYSLRCKKCTNIGTKKWRDENVNRVKQNNYKTRERYRSDNSSRNPYDHTTNKKCGNCKEIKPASAFCKNRNTSTGLSSWCDVCRTTKNKKWRNKNKEYVKEYDNNRRRNNINRRIGCQLRVRLWYAIRGNAKKGSAVRDLGCTIEELKQHLEAKFVDGMSWDNYGEWHIDHIIPLASFDLTKRSQVKKACHYTNLQPLWAKDNLRKGAKR